MPADTENPNKTARKELENMVGLDGYRPRHAWKVEVIVPADLHRKKVEHEAKDS